MAIIAFHASHEQIDPPSLLDAVKLAEAAGFVHICFASDEAAARDIAHEQWRSNVFAPPVCWDLEMAAHFDEESRFVRPEDMHHSVLISSDPHRFIDWLAGYAALGFEGIYLHHVGIAQRAFIETFGAQVLPALAKG